MEQKEQPDFRCRVNKRAENAYIGVTNYHMQQTFDTALASTSTTAATVMEQLVMIRWDRAGRFKHSPELEERMRVPTADGDVLPLADALFKLLVGMSQKWKEHGGKSGFIAFASRVGIETAEAGQKMFNDLICASDNKSVDVRACELVNNFIYTITMMIEGIALRAARPALNADGKLDAISFLCDISLGGLIQHRSESGKDTDLKNYVVMRSVREGGNQAEAELQDHHIRQVFRFTPEEMEGRRRTVLEALKVSMAHLRRL